MQATYAEFYAAMRSKALAMGMTTTDELGGFVRHDTYPNEHGLLIQNKPARNAAETGLLFSRGVWQSPRTISHFFKPLSQNYHNLSL